MILSVYTLLTYLSCLSYNMPRMKKKDFKKPKFSIDRSRRGDLVSQVAAGLRMSRRTGFYQPGEILPPVRDLAEILEIGKSVAEQAIAMIREEGLISPRPAIGSVVCAPDRPLWKGQVLIVVPPSGNIWDNALSAILRDEFTSNGYLAQTVTVPRKPNGKFDFSLLELMLRQQTDLVVQLHDKTEISNWLSRQGTAFIRQTAHKVGRLPRGCAGVIRWSCDSANAAFAEHCREMGVNEVAVMSAWDADSVVKALCAEGIRSNVWSVETPPGASGTVVAQCALEFMNAKLADRSNSSLPKALFFDDDYIASGALTAMLWAGVRIPEDVRVATFATSSCGSGLVSPIPLTRTEVDPIACGRTIAGTVLDYLKTGIFPPDVTIGPAFIKGKTF